MLGACFCCLTKEEIFCLFSLKKTLGDKKATAAVPGTAETGEGIPRLTRRDFMEQFIKVKGKLWINQLFLT